jgi:hypothetical protein
MLENPKVDPQRPPPLPKSIRPRGRALDRARAFLEIRRIRLVEGARRLWQRTRRRPAIAGLVAAGVVLVSGLGAAVALHGLPDMDLDVAPKSVADARADARARPNDAAAQRELGHRLWAAKKHHSAVRAYGRALSLDASVADSALVAHLVASFGGRDQREAEALIWKNKLVAAEDALKRLVTSKVHGVRWGAVRTLDRLGKGSKGYWETAYIADLDSPTCEVRQAAVEKLGTIGTRRAVTALRAEKAEDEKTGGWFKSRCLGDRLDDAEQQILARR